MIENMSVDVEARNETGKNACRRLRRAGKIPGVVYGLGRPPFLVSADEAKVEEILKLESGKNTIFSLSLVGQNKTRVVMIKQLQRDPVTEDLTHVDFVRVDPEKRLEVTVPIRIVGTATGVKNEGGLLDFIHRQVEVECLPGDIPEHLDVDVSPLHVNQHVSVADLRVTGGVRILDEPETVIAVIVPPRKEEEPVVEEVAPVEEEGEPEVLKKGKEAEEGEASGESE